MLLAGLKKKKNDVTEVSMSVANIWKAAQGDCNISIFVQYCLPCPMVARLWILALALTPSESRVTTHYSQSASHWEGVSYGQWANKRWWWLASKSWNLGSVPRLKIHKPAIGTGGSALVVGEVALKILRPEGYQGGCDTVFGIVEGWTYKMVAKGRAYCCFCRIFVIMFLLGFWWVERTGLWLRLPHFGR